MVSSWTVHIFQEPSVCSDRHQRKRKSRRLEFPFVIRIGRVSSWHFGKFQKLLKRNIYDRLPYFCTFTERSQWRLNYARSVHSKGKIDSTGMFDRTVEEATKCNRHSLRSMRRPYERDRQINMKRDLWEMRVRGVLLIELEAQFYTVKGVPESDH